MWASKVVIHPAVPLSLLWAWLGCRALRACWVTFLLRNPLSTNARSSDKCRASNGWDGADGLRVVAFGSQDGAYGCTVVCVLVEDVAVCYPCLFLRCWVLLGKFSLAVGFPVESEWFSTGKSGTFDWFVFVVQADGVSLSAWTDISWTLMYTE